jgi:pantoate--beta-alanine ligase
MSSRNRYLDPAERSQALALGRGLDHARQLVAAGQRDVPAIEKAVRDVLTSAGLTRIDYVALRDPDTLAPMNRLERDAVLLIAAYVGNTRLIDNGRLRLLLP